MEVVPLPERSLRICGSRSEIPSHTKRCGESPTKVYQQSDVGDNTKKVLLRSATFGNDPGWASHLHHTHSDARSKALRALRRHDHCGIRGRFVLLRQSGPRSSARWRRVGRRTTEEMGLRGKDSKADLFCLCCLCRLGMRSPADRS